MNAEIQVSVLLLWINAQSISVCVCVCVVCAVSFSTAANQIHATEKKKVEDNVRHDETLLMTCRCSAFD